MLKVPRRRGLAKPVASLLLFKTPHFDAGHRANRQLPQLGRPPRRAGAARNCVIRGHRQARTVPDRGAKCDLLSSSSY